MTDNGDTTKQHTESLTDFVDLEQRTDVAERQTQSALCCCEYIDKDNKQFHVLGCCCNCEDFDLVCTRIITCRRIDPVNKHGMLLAFQDRLRIPWRGGAKQMSPEALMPVIFVPLAIGLAAINAVMAVIMFLATFGVIGYIYALVKREQGRTRFFCMWMLWSVVYIIVLFEFTVPLLELLPEENLILVVFTTISLYCLWRTKQRASLNHVVQTTTQDELPGITEATAAEEEEEEVTDSNEQTTLLLEHDLLGATDVIHHQPNICEICRKYMPPRTDHCVVCGVCVLRRDHHSYWLDCCVGERNHHYYMMGLIFALLALILGSNLTLTAVCHPFLVVRFLNVPIMLPDDCSEVFDDYELAIAFIIAAYSLLIALYVLMSLTLQFYLISRGITLQESRRGQCGNRKAFTMNWRNFFC